MNKKWVEGELDNAISLIKDGKRYDEIGLILNRTSNSVRRKLSSVDVYYETYNPKPSIDCKEGEKYCATCGNIKIFDEFNKNKTKRDGLNSICRECSNKRSSRYYLENTEHHRKTIRIRNKKLILQNQKNVFNYLKNNPCIDCSNNNPVMLDFDHRDNVDKIGNISQLITWGSSWKKIKNEIDKCDVRCSNCHRMRTARQQGWYQNLINDGFLDENYNFL